MSAKKVFGTIVYLVVASLLLAVALPPASALAKVLIPQADNPNPPATPVKLVFVHHSTGGNWLADPNNDQPYGGLGIALRDNNYFVSATNYGWGPDSIGDRTDIPNWPEWFTGPDSSTYLDALHAESGQNVGDFGSWARLATDPGGENEVIMFKSCFPNSDLYGNPDDPPASGPDDQFTVSNAKAVYRNLLTRFEARQDKLFVVITAPPMGQGEYASDYQTAAQRAANARAFNDWLVNEWLSGYAYNNVAVFDYYNVLTSNGSAGRVDDPGTNEEPNDAGSEDGNHHRWWNGSVQHIQTVSNDYSAYPTDSSWDSHPTTAGHQKATAEFVPLLNVYYHRWKDSPAVVQPSPTATPERAEQATPTPTPQGEAQPTSTLPPAPVAGAVDDFEAAAGDWEADAEAGSTIECGPDAGMAHGGSASLRIYYDLKSDGWAYCGQNFESSQNWGESTGLSLWLSSDKEEERVTLMLFSGDPQGLTPFEAYLESAEGWTQLVIPWTGFVRAEWADEGGLSEVDPARVSGYGFSVGAYEGVNKGTIWVDDVGLITGEIQPPAQEPTPTPTAAPAEEPEPTATPQPSTSAEPTATAEPTVSGQGERGGGPCPLATALPLAATALVLTRKRHRPEG
jgi:hypothetical protein